MKTNEPIILQPHYFYGWQKKNDMSGLLYVSKKLRDPQVEPEPQSEDEYKDALKHNNA